MQPLVTINILSYNRKDDLRNTLQKVFEQDYKNTEIIVVDNNSSDGSVEMVKSEFPAVLLIELQNNIGIAGWNEGAIIAKGEYLLFLDDDSYPEKDALHKCMLTMEQYPNCAVLALNVFNTELKYNETERGNVIQVPSFIGCGVLHRKQFFIKTGMYSENIFLYVHEIEFSIRTLNKGYAIKYNPEAKIYHTYSKRNRLFKNHNTVDIKKQYYSNRNIIIVLLSHFSFHRVYGRVLRLFTGRILFGITKRSAYVILKGFSAGIWVVLKNWKYRQIVSNEVQKRYEYGKFAGGFFETGQYAFKRPAWLRQRNS